MYFYLVCPPIQGPAYLAVDFRLPWPGICTHSTLSLGIHVCMRVLACLQAPTLLSLVARKRSKQATLKSDRILHAIANGTLAARPP